DHVTGREFNGLDAVSVFHDEFSSIVFVRMGKEESGGKVSADAVPGAGDFPDGVVHMSAEGLASGISIEEGRENPGGQSGRDEERVIAQRLEDHALELAGGRRIFGEL